MTKEQYKKYLESDYWKGYSYSLIKERGYTCHDCNRTFRFRRNMLQVHHLVYRDVPPWAYRPHEMIVLCESCHRKRHGITNTKKGNTRQSPSWWMFIRLLLALLLAFLMGLYLLSRIIK